MIGQATMRLSLTVLLAFLGLVLPILLLGWNGPELIATSLFGLSGGLILNILVLTPREADKPSVYRVPRRAKET